jgi:hypothetical protein
MADQDIDRERNRGVDPTKEGTSTVTLARNTVFTRFITNHLLRFSANRGTHPSRAVASNSDANHRIPLDNSGFVRRASVDDGTPGSMALILLGLLVVPWLVSCSRTEVHPIPAAPSVKAAEDLSGCFRRVRFDDSVMESMNQSEPWPEPYQIYCFLSDGTLRTVSSNKPLDRPIGEVLDVMEQMPKVQSFSIPAPGVVVTRHDATGNVFAWLTSEFVTQNRIHGHDFEPGDVHMAIIGKTIDRYITVI